MFPFIGLRTPTRAASLLAIRVGLRLSSALSRIKVFVSDAPVRFPAFDPQISLRFRNLLPHPKTEPVHFAFCRTDEKGGAWGSCNCFFSETQRIARPVTAEVALSLLISPRLALFFVSLAFPISLIASSLFLFYIHFFCRVLHCVRLY